MSIAISFDTLDFIESLVKAGVPEEQAKAEARAINNAFKQIVESKDLATKQDIATIQHNIAILESNLRRDMAVQEERMTANLYKALLIQVFAIAGLFIAVVKFMN